MPVHPYTLGKEERIYSKKLIDALFKGGHSKSMSAFPIRMVYMPLPQPDLLTGGTAGPQILVSVPKRCFKRAVKRNRVKRQIREAYRRNKQLTDRHDVAIAFIWLDNMLRPSSEVEARVTGLLRRLAEKLDSKRHRHDEPHHSESPQQQEHSL